MSDRVDIVVAAPQWERISDAQATVHRAVAAAEIVLESAGEERDIVVLLCDDAEMRRLNKAWRGKDSPTNVLSFPTAQGPTSQNHLGDIAIAFETMAREASDEGKDFSAHLAHLVVHGYLHLVGYDHEADAEAEEMETLERRILTALDVPDPYRDQTESSQTNR